MVSRFSKATKSNLIRVKHQSSDIYTPMQPERFSILPPVYFDMLAPVLSALSGYNNRGTEFNVIASVYKRLPSGEY
jgi:hypothetical protein